MKAEKIISADDSRIKLFTGLTEKQLRNKDLFIAESDKVIVSALENGCEPVLAFMPQSRFEWAEKRLGEILKDVPVYVAEDDLAKTIAGYKMTRGFVCAMKKPPEKDAVDILKTAKKVAVLENITDSTNVGAIFRSAAALGMDAVLLSPECADPMCRRSVRVSMAAVLSVPWAYVKVSGQDWKQNGVKIFKDAGFVTVALALSQNNVKITDNRLKEAEKIALFLGTEGQGLFPQTISACDFTAKIPMSHNIDSLNVAAAGALAFWELCNK